MLMSLIATLVKRLGAFCLVFVIAWHVTHHAGPRQGKAIVQVSRTDHVVVSVDNRLYRIDSGAQVPLVCRLDPGEHYAQVWQWGKMRGEVHFRVEPGREIVIPPFDRPEPDARPADASSSISASGRATADGLLARHGPAEPTSARN